MKEPFSEKASPKTLKNEKIEHLILDWEYIRISNKKLSRDFQILTDTFRASQFVFSALGIFSFTALCCGFSIYAFSLSIVMLIFFTPCFPLVLFCNNCREDCSQLVNECQFDEKKAEVEIRNLKKLLEVEGNG